MKKTTSMAKEGVTIAIIFLSVFLIAFSTYADERGATERGREESGRAITPTPTPSPDPTPPPPPPPSNPSGGITNVTTGEVSSGGNTGGNVTTGDEHLELFVVNIGPTNPPPPPIVSPEPVAPSPSEPSCSSDRRASDACPSDSSRAR